MKADAGFRDASARIFKEVRSYVLRHRTCESPGCLRPAILTERRGIVGSARMISLCALHFEARAAGISGGRRSKPGGISGAPDHMGRFRGRRA
jgi:hypothetical protein